jgi:TPR repeat protein
MDDALAAYEAGKFEQAGELLKALEDKDARAAGVTCELLVRKLLPRDDERGQQACETAVKGHDPHGLMWRSRAGERGFATLGFSSSDVAALGYLAEAAEAGYPPAFARLCERFLRKGEFQKAAPFCKFAAARDVPEGLYQYSIMLLEGKGVVQDFKKGMTALTLSAQLNYAPAYAKLSELARNGASGVPKDPIKAYGWLLLATAADPDSKELAGAKESLAGEIGAAKVSTAQKNAAMWKARPAPTSRDFYASR